MNNCLKLTQKLATAVDEFDFADRLKPSAIMEYFQNAATAHADEIGVGFEQMKSQNLCWVLNRMSAVIEESPRLDEELAINTMPHKPGVVDAIRDYYITDLSGKTLIRGTSRWCVLDIGNKAIRRCAPLFRYEDSQYIAEFALKEGNPQLPELSTIAGESEARFADNVKITDLDRNGHVNNARYGDIIVNCCDFGFYSTHKIKAFDFNFLCEMKMGNDYIVDVKNTGNESYFEAHGNTRVNPIFRARILWE